LGYQRVRMLLLENKWAKRFWGLAHFATLLRSQALNTAVNTIHGLLAGLESVFSQGFLIRLHSKTVWRYASTTELSADKNQSIRHDSHHLWKSVAGSGLPTSRFRHRNVREAVREPKTQQSPLFRGAIQLLTEHTGVSFVIRKPHLGADLYYIPAHRELV
jgi:hypothetical protein